MARELFVGNSTVVKINSKLILPVHRLNFTGLLFLKGLSFVYSVVLNTVGWKRFNLKS